MSTQEKTKFEKGLQVTSEGHSADGLRLKVNPTQNRTKVYDSILWQLIEKSGRTEDSAMMFGFSGATENAGTTTVSTNVAERAAKAGLGRVLLIDCNHNRPEVHKVFHLKSSFEGLIEYSTGSVELKSVVRSTEIADLYILPYASRSGVRETPVPDPRFVHKLFDEIRGLFEIVVVDLPVCDQLIHIAPLVRQLDASILVVRSESLCKSDAVQRVKRLTNQGIVLAGTVVNRARRYLPTWFERFL